MKCPACSHENRSGAKFCEECGAPLKCVCAGCGAELRLTAKFCDECGAAAAPSAMPSTGARKVVTVVFADLVGSTALHERLDAESARGLMDRYYEALRGVVVDHGGTVVKLLGDGVLAAFGVPQVAEDDAIRAVRAGVAMQDAFRALADVERAVLADAGLRVAINTGEVVVSGRNDDVIGDPVNVAARLQQEAGNGDVVIGEDTERLVAALVTLDPLGSFTLKGRSEPVRAYRVASLDRPTATTTAAFVGRDDELARMVRVYDAAVASPAAQLAVLLGSPGLGKSRLIDELARRLGGKVTVVSGHCDAAGGATFAPIADALRKLVGVDDGTTGDALRAAIERTLSRESVRDDAARAGVDDAERARVVAGIASLLSGSPASPEETFSVVRRFLAVLAAGRPVVLVIDDVHWAEPLLLDLVEHLVQWGAGLRLFVLVSARPELRDKRSSLMNPGGVVSEVVTLGGLDAGAAMRLAANVIGAADLPATVAGKVLAASEGNPLFVGELIRMLVHDGVLEKQGDRWTVAANVAALEMPPTIHALLAARIERLRPDDRVVLECAAVVGRHFSRAAVAELLPRDVVDLDARLEALWRSELIERDSGWFLGEPVLRFHHVLIRDAAYRRLLKNTRAELHERFADWIEARAGGAAEHDESIGWHLEQAHQLLGELGAAEEKARALGERAARRLAAAGRRALARDDVALAANLLGRAVARLHADDAARADLVLDWCEALLAAGDVAQAATAVEELGRFVGGSDRLSAWHTCFLGQLTALTAPEKLHETADSVAAAAERLAALGDAAGEAKAHFVHAQALARLGKVGASEAALDRALAAARAAGDRRRANAVLAGAPIAALWGPSPVTRASGRCLDVVRVLRITQGAPPVEAVALSCQGVLEALRGRTDAARRMIASARKMVEELGIAHRLFETDAFAGRIDLLERDAASAERLLRNAYEGLRTLGLGIDAARAAALLARALLMLDRVAEAEALSHESETLAGDDLQAAIAWRGVRAEALARRGEAGAAVELAEAAVSIAATTDALLDHADARLALAAALRAAGRASAADAEERHALELWQTKGATLLVEQTRGATGRVAPTQPAAPERMTFIGSTSRAGHRVRPNAASALCARLGAVMTSGSLDDIPALFSEAHEEIDHTTGSSYGREAVRDYTERFLRSQHPVLSYETIGTLGERLSLDRRFTGARATGRGRFDVGLYETEKLSVLEVDASGRALRQELFGIDHEPDAAIRLYERHAELLPEGAERARAAVVARSIRTLFETGGRFAPESLVGSLSPGIELVDHRTLGFPGLKGIEEFVRMMRSLVDLAEDTKWSHHEILALAPDGMVTRTTGTGTDRASGGKFEMPTITLNLCGSDGLIARCEVFDADHEAQALARFAELTGAACEPATTRRRLRANAATLVTERFAAAIVARDEAALTALVADSLRVVDHPNRMTYGRDGHIESMRQLLGVPDPRFEVEPLATLGDWLSLSRYAFAASGATGPDFDVGEWERRVLVLCEADASGRICHLEDFADESLPDAVTQLYERYASTLPAGSARDCAEAIARSVAVLTRVPSPEEWGAILAPEIEGYDHRTVGYGRLHGSDAMRDALAALVGLCEQITYRLADILATHPSAALVHTHSAGVLRAGGGAFERETLVLFGFDDDGDVVRYDQFDVAQRDLAFARFDALVGGLALEDLRQPSTCRFANAATQVHEQIARAWRMRDWEGVSVQHPPVAEVNDRRRLVRLRADGAQNAADLRFLFDVPGSRWNVTPIATRGERLALSRSVYEGNVDAEGGPLAIESLILNAVDADRRSRAVVLFDPDDLDAAYAELDARYEAGEAKEHPLASSWLRRFSDAIAHRDWGALAAISAPEMVAQVHRAVTFGMSHGVTEWSAAFKQLFDLAPDTRLRVDHVRASNGGLIYEFMWLGTRDGGEFEIPGITVVEIDRDGRQRRVDVYDVDRVADARARFEEISARTSSSASFANAATRFNEQVASTWAARDWERLKALHASTGVMDDRRRMMRMKLASDDGSFEQLRFLFDVPDSRWSITPIATRGERLALSRCIFEGNVDADGGALAIDYLMVDEVDHDGRSVAVVIFDPDDTDAAYAELDGRFMAGEGAEQGVPPRSYFTVADAFDRRDWQAMRAAYAPGVTFDDHRLLGWGRTLADADVVIRTQQALVELSPDVRYRIDHLRVARGAALVQVTQIGTRDGGAFESPGLIVTARGADGRILGFDSYDVEQIDDARARFAALMRAPRSSAAFFANAASRAADRTVRAFNAREWNAMLAAYAPAHRMDDRRKLMCIEVAGDEFLANERLLFEVPGSAWRVELVATRGERLALCRAHFTAGGEDAGPMAVEALDLIEVDADGRRSLLVVFDPDDLDAAYAELDALYEVGEAADDPLALLSSRGIAHQLAQRNWDALAAPFAPTVVASDHRLAGWGEMRGPAAVVSTMRAMVDLAPDVRLRVDHARSCIRGTLTESVWCGTRDGGAFESANLSVVELDEEGRAKRIDFYDTRHLDTAWARFKELAASENHDEPTRLPAAAAVAMARWQQAYEVAASTGDWDRVRRVCTPDLVFEDRQHIALLTGGVELMIASARERALSGASMTRQSIGGYGDRVALWRMLWSGGPSGGRFETEYLRLAEVDETGLISAIILYDLVDLPAARSDALARAARIDSIAAASVTRLDDTSALFDRFGSSEGRGVTVARAGLGEVGPDLLQIPANAATHAYERFGLCVRANDWEAFEALCAPIAFEDRRRLLLSTADCGGFTAGIRYAWDAGLRADPTLLAVAGDRLMMQRNAYTSRTSGGDSVVAVIETLEVLEVDDQGRIVSYVLFDPDDRRAASRYMRERFVRSGASPLPEVLAKFGSALNDRDIHGVRAVLPDDFYLHDHRLAGLGRIEGADEYMKAVSAILELSPDVTSEVIYDVARSRHGALSVTRRFGTNAEGGVFESLFLALTVVRGREVAGIEVFELDDVARARARLEALRPDPLGMPPNAATRVLDGVRSGWVARDWDAILALAAPELVFEDRSRRALVTGDARTWIDSMRFAAEVDARVDTTLIATLGERVAVDHIVWHGKPGGDAFEFERFRLLETDTSGRARAVLFFDAEDRAAAASEAIERFANGEAAGCSAQETIVRSLHAWNAHEWDTLRDFIEPQAEIDDHRPLSLGKIGRDEWLESWRVGAELAPDALGEWIRILAWHDHGHLALTRVYGTRDGGAFESLFIILMMVGGGLIRHYEFFSVEDEDRALARFAELSAGANDSDTCRLS